MRSLNAGKAARLAWLATGERHQAWEMTIEKIAIGTKRPGNRTKKSGAGVQGGRAFAFIDDDTWGGLNFLASDAFVGEEHPDKREVNLKDTADDDTPGVAPWEMGKNIRMAKPMEGVVARGALVGKGFENEQVFFPARAILVAHHRPDDPPINSTPIHDSGDGKDDWVAGLHSLTRVRPWVHGFCGNGTTPPDPRETATEFEDDTPSPKIYSALLNFTKSEGDFTGWGGAHFAEGESVLSAEAYGVLRHGAPKHQLSVDPDIRRSAIDIDRAIHGDGTDPWSAPVEYTRAAWRNGSRGPHVKRVERRMDFATIHDHPCGPRPGMWKDMTWDSFREYNPPPTDDPGSPDPAPAIGTGAEGFPEPQVESVKAPPTDDEDPGGVKDPTRLEDPGGTKTGDPGVPSYVPRTTRPTTSTPNEVESPSRYGHPIPDGPKSPSTGPTDWPSGGASDNTPNYSIEHDSFWLSRFGFTEQRFNEQPLTSHLIAGAVYEGTSAPWIPVKDQTEILNIRDGYIEDRERPATGPGWDTFAPANVQLHNLYPDQNPVFDETKLDYSAGVFAANGWDTRFGMGHRLPNSAFFARGFDVSLDFSSDADNPDINIVGRNATGGQSTGALKYNGTAIGTGSGDVTGPASATQNNFPSFGDTSGKQLIDSGWSDASFLKVANDLSDLNDAETARGNLGLGDRATQDDGDDVVAGDVSFDDGLLPTGIATIGGSANDYDASSVTVIHMVTLGTNVDLTGIAAPASGSKILFISRGAGSEIVTLKHEDANSSAANRFDLPSASDLVLALRDGVTIAYIPTLNRWRVVGKV